MINTNNNPMDVVARGWLDKLVERTVYEDDLLRDCVPLQFQPEYVRYRECLSQQRDSIELVVPMRKAETVLPLVSLLAWTKVGSVLRSSAAGGPSLCATVVREMELAGTSDARAAIECAMRSVGCEGTPKTIGEVWEETVAIGGPTQRAEAMASRVFKDVDDQRTVASLATMATLVAYCMSRPGRVLVCGQDQAPLIHAIRDELCAESDAIGRQLPVALLLPLLPMSRGTHVLLNDSRDDVQARLDRCLKSMPDAVGQRAFARLLGRLLAMESDGTPRHDPGLRFEQYSDLRDHAVRIVWDWMVRVRESIAGANRASSI